MSRLGQGLAAEICFYNEPLTAEEGPRLQMYVRLPALPVNESGEAELDRELSYLLGLLQVAGWKIDINGEAAQVQAVRRAADALVARLASPEAGDEWTRADEMKQHEQANKEIHLLVGEGLRG